jgi:hypothetical protein
MKRFDEGADRGQSTLFPAVLTMWARTIRTGRSMDGLDLAKLGFDGVQPLAMGRPAYHPATQLKIYIYGYLNRVQSSRRLEQECQHTQSSLLRSHVRLATVALHSANYRGVEVSTAVCRA